MFLFTVIPRKRDSGATAPLLAPGPRFRGGDNGKNETSNRDNNIMTTDASTLCGNWNYPTKVRFGVGRITELPAACQELGIKRPLIVTDPGLAGLPMIKEALAGLKAAGLGAAVFSDVKGNPIGKNVDDGLAAY